MMDSSASVGNKNFETSRTFVQHVAERFLTAETKNSARVRVGVAQYSRKPKLEVELTQELQLLSESIEKASYQDDSTDLLEAMEFARKIFRERRDARGAWKKLVLFSDGGSQGVTSASLEQRVRDLDNDKIEIFVISAGSQVNEVNLNILVSKGKKDSISNGRRYRFHVSDYPSLLKGVFYQTVSRQVSLH